MIYMLRKSEQIKHVLDLQEREIQVVSQNISDSKLNRMGIKAGYCLALVLNLLYLTDRSQKVAINGLYSMLEFLNNLWGLENEWD